LFSAFGVTLVAAQLSRKSLTTTNNKPAMLRTSWRNGQRLRRVSTDKQTKENKLQELRQIAERRGWEIIAQYSDAGISGSKGRDGRPGLDQMLKDASKRPLCDWAVAAQTHLRAVR
jgi:hypothetical protein